MHNGCEIHIVTQEDSLGLGAIKLDINEWAYPVDDFGKQYPPNLGDRVFAMRENNKLYWIGKVIDIQNIMG